MLIKLSAELTEEELIQRCHKLDQSACKTLYDQNSGWMYALCLRYARDTDLAKDMLQDAFIRIFEKLNTYRGEGNFKGWMRRLTVNVALGYFQKTEFKINKTGVTKAERELEPDNNLLEQIGRSELQHLINALPNGQRLVFNAFCIEGYSHQEIAEMLGISEGTSKSQLFDAKKTLRQAIELNYMTARKIV